MLYLILFIVLFICVKEPFDTSEIEYLNWQREPYRLKLMNKMFHISHKNSDRIRTTRFIEFFDWQNNKSKMIVHPIGITLIKNKLRYNNVNLFKYKDWNSQNKDIIINNFQFNI